MVTKNRRTLELKLGKLGLILFVSGMSLLLFSTFLLGMLVGKHLDAYPERYSDGLVNLVRDRLPGLALAPQKKGTPPSVERVAAGDHASGDEAFDLTFYKVLGDKKNSKQNMENPVIPDSHKVDKTAIPVATANDHSSTDEVSAGPASGKADPAHLASSRKADIPVLPDQTKVPAESAAPGSSSLSGSAGTDKTVKKGGFQVQVAAYTDVRQAEKMANRLKALGFSAMIVSKDIPDKGRWFRVIAGGFENRQKADSAASRIAGKIKGVKCIIRRNKGGGA